MVRLSAWRSRNQQRAFAIHSCRILLASRPATIEVAFPPPDGPARLTSSSAAEASAMANAPDPPEIALSAAWHGQQFRSPLRTTDGVSIEIIHRGVWSNGLGPDFQDALLLFDGRDLRSGSVEIHLRTSHWRQHRHHLDPRYESVVV